MKWCYRLILPVLFLFSVEAKSQVYNYIPFPDSNITWSGYNSCYVHSSSWLNFWSMKIEGDSMLNGYTYQKLGSIALLREDSFKRVYCINLTGYVNPNYNEQILYDFSLKKNDTITNAIGELVVVKVDTPTYFSIPRRTLHLVISGSTLGDTWIEGIGSSNGPIDALRFYPEYCHWSYLCSAFQDTTQLFQGVGLDFYRCNPVNDVRVISDLAFINISPNPVTTTFTLQLSSAPNTPTYFQLYDAMGRLVRQEEINSNSTTINRHQLPNGIYFWQLLTGQNVLQRGKVVME